VNRRHESADQNETVNVIVEAARRLEKNNVGEMFRIYVLQVGDDRTAASPLREIGIEVARQTRGRVSPFSKDRNV
jgi:hypothetical protein